MKRLIVLSVFIALLATSGCGLLDPIFYQADEVEVESLSSFDSSLTVPRSRDEVEIALLGASLDSMTAAARNTNTMTTISSELKSNIPGLDVILGSASLPLAPDEGSRSAEAGAHISVENEVFDEGGGVTVTIHKAAMKLEGEVDSVQQPRTTKAAFDGELAMRVDDDSEFSNVTNVIVNAVAKGDMEVNLGYDVDGFVTSVKAAADFKSEAHIGLTLNDTANGVGGKFVISVKLWTEVNIAMSENDTQAPDLANQMSSLELTVDVYNNNNSLVASYVYTAEELAPLINTVGYVIM